MTVDTLTAGGRQVGNGHTGYFLSLAGMTFEAEIAGPLLHYRGEVGPMRVMTFLALPVGHWFMGERSSFGIQFRLMAGQAEFALCAAPDIGVAEGAVHLVAAPAIAKGKRVMRAEHAPLLRGLFMTGKAQLVGMITQQGLIPGGVRLMAGSAFTTLFGRVGTAFGAELLLIVTGGADPVR